MTFAPTAGSNQTAQLNVNATNTASQTVLLSGTGNAVAMTVTPKPLAFGGVIAGASSVLPVTVTNSGAGNLLLGAPTITGSARYTITITTTSCGASVAPGASCTISVSFAPNAGGIQAATLNVNATNTTPQTVSLTGTGLVPVLTVAPAAALAFGNVARAASSTLDVTVSNTGTANLLLTAPTVSATVPPRGDNNPGAYSLTTTCGATLAPLATCTISVTFAPGTVGNKTASLNVNATNAAPRALLMSGTGT